MRLLLRQSRKERSCREHVWYQRRRGVVSRRPRRASTKPSSILAAQLIGFGHQQMSASSQRRIRVAKAVVGVDDRARGLCPCVERGRAHACFEKNRSPSSGPLNAATRSRRCRATQPPGTSSALVVTVDLLAGIDRGYLFTGWNRRERFQRYEHDVGDRVESFSHRRPEQDEGFHVEARPAAGVDLEIPTACRVREVAQRLDAEEHKAAGNLHRIIDRVSNST